MGRCAIELDFHKLLPDLPTSAYVCPLFLHATGSRHSSLQTSTTSIIYFAWLLTAIFALPGRITVRTPKIWWDLCGRILGIARTGRAYCTLSQRKEM
jgi:hypothetical protein